MDFILPFPHPEVLTGPFTLRLTVPTSNGNIKFMAKDHDHMMELINSLIKDLTFSLEIIRKDRPTGIDR